MKFDDYVALCNDPRRPLALGIYRVQAPVRPVSPPSRRPAPPPPRRGSTPAVVQRVGFADGSPATVCKICHEPAHVGRSWTCQTCAAEIKWRVAVARSGLRVAW
jgi:hypothetical protein